MALIQSLFHLFLFLIYKLEEKKIIIIAIVIIKRNMRKVNGSRRNGSKARQKGRRKNN